MKLNSVIRERSGRARQPMSLLFVCLIGHLAMKSRTGAADVFATEFELMRGQHNRLAAVGFTVRRRFHTERLRPPVPFSENRLFFFLATVPLLQQRGNETNRPVAPPPPRLLSHRLASWRRNYSWQSISETAIIICVFAHRALQRSDLLMDCVPS